MALAHDVRRGAQRRLARDGQWCTELRPPKTASASVRAISSRAACAISAAEHVAARQVRARDPAGSAAKASTSTRGCRGCAPGPARWRGARLAGTSAADSATSASKLSKPPPWTGSHLERATAARRRSSRCRRPDRRPPRPRPGRSCSARRSGSAGPSRPRSARWSTSRERWANLRSRGVGIALAERHQAGAAQRHIGSVRSRPR